ncbi:IS3 family transposase [Hafnia alvei]|uniref:IS3 family transposase n=1 Tax=Hafnia alvei TaxID=569 RepID=UPI004044C663
MKAERVNYRRYETRSQGIADVIDYIDNFYNLKRRHYRLGSISLDEYERRLQHPCPVFVDHYRHHVLDEGWI